MYIAEIPTNTYIILDSKSLNIVITRLKLNNPTNAQLRPPITSRIKAIQETMLISFAISLKSFLLK